MDCLYCGEAADYDRVAIDRASGDVLGCLCMACESEWLSDAAKDGDFSMAVCFACGASSEFLFPRWNSIVESEGRGGSVDAEYHITLTTPASCGRCLGPDPPTPEGATHSPSEEASSGGK